MKVTVDLGLWLHGGTVMVQLAEQDDAVTGKRLTDMVRELLEAHECGADGAIPGESAAYLRQVEHELRLAADVLASRLRIESALAGVRGVPV